MTYDPEIGIDLVTTGKDGTPVSLKKLRCDKASEILGIWLATSGNNKNSS